MFTSQSTLIPSLLLVSFLSGCGSDSTDHYVEGVEAYEAATTEEEFKAAADFFTQAIEEDEEDTEALVARGLTYDALGQTEKAIADYEQAIKLDPENTDALMNLGAVMHESQKFQRAVDAYSRVLLLEEDDADAYRNRALAYASLNQFDEAVKDFTWAIILTPYVDPVLYSERADVWKELQNQAQYDIDISIVDATSEIEKNGNDAAAYSRRGQSLYLLGEYGIALGDFEKAVGLEEDNAEILISLASTENMLGMQDKAIENFKKAMELSPENGNAHAGIAIVLQNTGDYQGAIQNFEQAVKLSPKSNSAKAGLAWVLATAPDASIRDGSKSQKLAREVCESTNWGNWTFLDVHAAASAENGDFKTAVESASKAIIQAADIANVSEMKERLVLYQQQKPYRISKD